MTFPRRSSHANGTSHPRHTRKRSSLLPTIHETPEPFHASGSGTSCVSPVVTSTTSTNGRPSGQQVPPTARIDRPSAVHAMSRVSGSNPAKGCAAPPSAGTSQTVSWYWLRRNEEGELRPVRRPPQRKGACGASLDEAVGIEPDEVCRAVQIDDQYAESRRDRRELLAVRRPHRAGPDERRRPRDGDPARRPLELAGRGEPTHHDRLLAETGLTIGEHGSVRGERGTLLQRGVTLRPRQEPGGSIGSSEEQVRWFPPAHRPRAGIEARYRDDHPLAVPRRRGLGPWDGGRRRRGEEPQEPEGHQGEHRGTDEARRDPFVPPLPIASGQDALEGVRRRLEALDTGPQQLSCIAHGVTPNASRSDERAR